MSEPGISDFTDEMDPSPLTPEQQAEFKKRIAVWQSAQNEPGAFDPKTGIRSAESLLKTANAFAMVISFPD